MNIIPLSEEEDGEEEKEKVGGGEDGRKGAVEMRLKERDFL